MTLTLHEHPFAAYCWKALIALYERDLPFEPHIVLDDADRARLAELWHLTSGGWAAGPEFTLADCAAAPALFYARIVQGRASASHPS
jgi:glutathione S-transferase